MKRKKQQKGFTLLEILAVAAIVALMAVFVVPNVFKKLGKAKANIARASMGILERGIEDFRYDCGRLPTQDEGLNALLEAPADLEEKWSGPYCKRSQLEDPWGNPFEYVAEGMINLGNYDLICFGADGVEGGEGDNVDIYND
ncbi:MAG: type II secretion system major pseudopilin GspG [Planctomycetota bacterium]